MVLIYSEDFESYMDGSLNGQGNWVGHNNFNVIDGKVLGIYSTSPITISDSSINGIFATYFTFSGMIGFGDGEPDYIDTGTVFVILDGHAVGMEFVHKRNPTHNIDIRSYNGSSYVLESNVASSSGTLYPFSFTVNVITNTLEDIIFNSINYGSRNCISYGTMSSVEIRRGTEFNCEVYYDNFEINGTLGGHEKSITATSDTLIKKLNATIQYTTDIIIKKLDITTQYTTDIIIKKLDNTILSTADLIIVSEENINVEIINIKSYINRTISRFSETDSDISISRYSILR